MAERAPWMDWHPDPRDEDARAQEDDDALCSCGHPLSEHADSGWGPRTVCTEPLPTFPEGGWDGVCPCVRHGDWCEQCERVTAETCVACSDDEGLTVPPSSRSLRDGTSDRS